MNNQQALEKASEIISKAKKIVAFTGAGISAESETKVKVGGTMTANPLTTLAGITVINELEAKNVHAELDKVSRYFMKGIEDISERYELKGQYISEEDIKDALNNYYKKENYH